MRRRTLLWGALPGIYAASVPGAANAAPTAGAAEGSGSEASASEGPAATGLQVPLRVVSYNIHAGSGADGRFDLERQAETIRRWNADIIGLQEVDVHWGARSRWRNLADDLATALGMRAFFGHIYDLAPPSEGAPRRQYGLAILSRYPIIRAHNHAITRLSTQTPDPTPAPAPGFPEVVVNVRGAHVHVYNTHLDYRGNPWVRELQVADMLQIMDRAPGRQQVLLLGDFNAPPGSAELAPLWDRLADSWPAAGDAAGLTYPARDPVKRIDYITTTPEVEIRDAHVPHTLASDHLPVLADLAVHRGRPR